jgi:hypothetical protein
MCKSMLIAVLVGVWLLLPAGAQAGLCLNEIMADPASDWDGSGAYSSRDDEWIEVYNSGPGHVDLHEYLLSDDSGLLTFGFEAGDVLAVGEARVIYGSQSVAWQQGHGQPSYGLRLGNDGDTAILWQLAGGDTLMVDSHTFNTYEAEDDRSTGRNPDGVGVWEIFDALNPYTGSTPPPGNGLAPTPGTPNVGDPPPVGAEAFTWGRVKARFAGK